MAIAQQKTLSEENKLPLKIAAFVALALGVAALCAPFYAGIAVTLVLGANFLIGGILQAFAAFKAQRWVGTLGLIILAAASIFAGLYIFAHPLIGLLTLTLVCIVALFVVGIAKLFWSIRVPTGRGRWFLVFSGVISILIAAMLYTGFPFTAVWAFGVLVGLHLIAEGAMLLGFLSQRT
jgi:uncharacterized membrane protein HdeD (DUF308 family)